MAIKNSDGPTDAGQADFWTRALTRPVIRQFTPNELQLAALEYCQWCNENPLYETDLRTADGCVIETPVAKVRAFTKRGLLLYLGLSAKTWANYTSDPNYEEVIEIIDNVIYTQKFENAAAGLLNPNVIVRDLGLSDKQDLSSSDGTMSPKSAVYVDTSKMTDEAMRQFLDATETNHDDEGAA